MNKHLKNGLIPITPAIICLLIFLLPAKIQEGLILKMASLNLWSWFTYIFVHQNVNHLFFNLLVYIPAILLTYALIPFNEKRNFYKIVLLTIILVPLLTLFLTTIMYLANLIPLFANSRGFSGISSMALGMLTFALSKKFHEKFGNPQGNLFLLNTCYVILFPSLAIMVFNISPKFTFFIFILWFFAIFNFIYNLRKKKIIINKIKNKEAFVLIGVFVLSLMGISLLIPVEIVNNGVVTNTLAHLFGYVIGFASLLLFSIIQQSALVGKH
jgi:hypothetical protein